MTKLAYIDNQQIVADAAQMLLESHLQWSGSQKDMPSRDIDYVQGQVINAFLEARFTVEEWNALSKEEQMLENAEACYAFKQAARLADRKWEAAMTLLGIEQ